jgi:GNAT superfamily N-acetyltransferase
MKTAPVNKYQLISDYKHIKKYRESFNKLALNIFGIDFEKWYTKKGWNENYICYSYIDGDQVIANASINKMTVVCEGTEYRAIQIGTVMTHPDYRSQGLSGKLLNHIINKYKKDSDFIYLFANKTVLDFYPKFGFERVEETRFSLKIPEKEKELIDQKTFRKLNPNKHSDYEIMERLASERLPISSILGVKDDQHLLMFYFLLAFSNAIYYLEEEDVIVIFNQEGSDFHLFDIVSKNKIDIDRILNQILLKETETIHFYFTPDFNLNHIQTELIIDSDDSLFVNPLIKRRLKYFSFPLTSHA